MSIRALAVSLFTTFAIWGCTQAPPAVTSEQESSLSDVQVPELALAVGEAPSPAMLEAALSGDPEAMLAVMPHAGTCHAATTCPGFGSCASWSSLAVCSTSCTTRCCHDAPLCNEPDVGGTIKSQQFRVCFDASGASCTEWRITSRSVCGC